MAKHGCRALAANFPPFRQRWVALMQRMVGWCVQHCGDSKEVDARTVVSALRAEAWHYAGLASVAEASAP